MYEQARTGHIRALLLHVPVLHFYVCTYCMCSVQDSMTAVCRSNTCMAIFYGTVIITVRKRLHV